MKKKILILLAAVVAVTTPLAPEAKAIDFSVSVGDRPYYHGGGYWHEGYYWVWVPGHYSRRRGGWVPGHYVRLAITTRFIPARISALPRVGSRPNGGKFRKRGLRRAV